MVEALTKFIAAHDWDALGKVTGWRVELDIENTDVVRLTLPARDGERYILRCVCDGYPRQAPSVRFATADGDVTVVSAWPAGDATFHEVIKLPPASFLCTDLTREGFAHHGDWRGRSNAWDENTHTLMDIFNYVQRMLSSKRYIKRAP
jgi:hypothetical protein